MSVEPYFIRGEAEAGLLAVQGFREVEYPQLKDKTYLDYAGTQLPAKSMIEAYAQDLSSRLYGNPHSAEGHDIEDFTDSNPSHLAGSRIDNIRKRVLRFFNANPDDFSLVFVQNATAAIRLVAECFEDYAAAARKYRNIRAKTNLSGSFWYGYHSDAHSSLVGARELATGGHRCFVDDATVEAWIDSRKEAPFQDQVALFGFPGQSNMTGRRLPLSWPAKLRAAGRNVYSLLDAAALTTTAQLDLDAVQPSFTAVSFYKIFGYPDLGGLIVHKSAAHMLRRRRYFGGGTVDMVISIGDNWAVKKEGLEEYLEEGTLPFHAIMALDHALDAHERLYGSMKSISVRTAALTKYAYERLSALQHSNGAPVVRFYTGPGASRRYGDAQTQGATVALNILQPDGRPVFFADVERAANRRRIYLRTGSVCNPGGVALYLDWSPRQMRAAHAAGHTCGRPLHPADGRAIGIVRISFGACSLVADVDRFVDFVADQYARADWAALAAPLAPPACLDASAASSDAGKSVHVDASLSRVRHGVALLTISRKKFRRLMRPRSALDAGKQGVCN